MTKKLDPTAVDTARPGDPQIPDPVAGPPPEGYGGQSSDPATTADAASILASWPPEAREAAQLVVDRYGAPDEFTASQMTWYSVGQWKRIVAQKAFWQHDFPAPHTDSVESFVDYHVPVAKVGELAEFDGSVMVERTSGEVSARCHDEQANNLALNLMHDIVTDTKDVARAREYYAKEFLDARRQQPTPYMERLRFTPAIDPGDPDVRLLSDEELEAAKAETR